MAFCVRCGKRIPEGIVFCPYCGTNLKEIMAGLEQPASQTTPQAAPQPAHQDFMAQRPTVEVQPLPQEQSFMEQRPLVQTQPVVPPVVEVQPVCEQSVAPPVEEAQPIYQQPAQTPVTENFTAPAQPAAEDPASVQEQPPVQQDPYFPRSSNGTRPPFYNPLNAPNQGYRPPFYTQQEDLGYLHVKKQEAPARGLTILGRILGILGMISSIIMMTAMLFLCSNYMDVMPFLAAFEEHSVLLFLGVFESIALSLAGVLLSRSAAKKGNPSTAAGKRLGIVGLVLSAINLVDLILALIVLLMA